MDNAIGKIVQCDYCDSIGCAPGACTPLGGCSKCQKGKKLTKIGGGNFKACY